MKKGILLIIGLIVSVCSFAQIDRTFSGKLSPYTVTAASSGKFNVSTTFTDDMGYWKGDSVAVNDVIIQRNNTACYSYRIDSVMAKAVNTMTIRVIPLDGGTFVKTQGAIFRVTTNHDFPVQVPGLSGALEACVNEYITILVDAAITASASSGARFFKSTDNFATFSPSSPAPANNDYCWDTRRGSLWQRTAGSFTIRVTFENGSLASTTYLQTNDTLLFDAALYNKAQISTLTSGTTIVISAPTNIASQAVGEIFQVIIQNNNDSTVTVNWNAVFGKWDMSAMTTEVTAGTTIGYLFQTITDGAEGVVLASLNDLGGGSSITTGTKGDINVVGVDTDWQIVADAVGANEISAGAVGTSEIATDGVGTQEIQNNAVTNGKMDVMPANTIKGNNTGGSLNPLDLTISQVNAMLGTATGSGGTGSGGVQEVAFFKTPTGLDGRSDFVVDTTAAATKVGIGTALPATELHVASTSTSDPRGIMSSQHSASTDAARIHFRKSRGTATLPSIITTGDMLGRMRFSGYDGAAYLQMASIDVGTTGTIGTNRVPTYMAFSTATDAAPSVLTERMRITENGNVGIGTATPAAQFNLVTPTSHDFRLAFGSNAPFIGVKYNGGKFAALTAGTSGSAFFYDDSGFFAIGSSPASGYTSNNIFGSVPNSFYMNSSGHVAMGTSTIASGSRLTLVGTGATSATNSLIVHNSTGTSNSLVVRDDGTVGINTSTPSYLLDISKSQNSQTIFQIQNTNGGTAASATMLTNAGGGNIVQWGALGASWTTSGALIGNAGYLYAPGSGGMSIVAQNTSGAIRFATGGVNEVAQFSATGKLGIGMTPTNFLDLTATTLTGSTATSALGIAQTWNTTGNPTAIFANITNTASGATSKLMDLQIGGVSQFNVSKAGVGTFVGDVNIPGETFGSAWDGVNEASSKNDVYDAMTGTTLIETQTHQDITITGSTVATRSRIFYNVPAGGTAILDVSAAGADTEYVVWNIDDTSLTLDLSGATWFNGDVNPVLTQGQNVSFHILSGVAYPF